MKIAFDATATPANLVGAGYYVKEILSLLDKNDDVELHIITRKDDASRISTFAPNSKIHAVSPNNIVARMTFQSYKLGTYVDSLNVDLFHGPHYQLPIKMKTKSIVTIHDTTLITHPNVHDKKKALYFSKMIPFAIKKSNAIIAVSKSSADDIKKIYGDNVNIFTCQLGVDKERFFPYSTNKDPQIEVDKKLLVNRGISGEYIGFLGLIEPRKSVPDLIEAFSKISSKFPKLKLVIAGSPGWGITQVREAIAKSGVATNIIMPGRLDDNEVGAFLRQAKAFVYPSLYEGFGLPVLEAMACATPTITSNSSSLKEVAGVGTNAGALLFKPNDVDKLTEILERLLGDKESLNDYSKNALERSKKFSWEKCVDEHIKAYKKTI